jgi:hypothetical protein
MLRTRIITDMAGDKQLITVKVGTTVQIILQNPDFMQHNLVLVKSKTMEKVGAAADCLAEDPNGAKMQHVPKMSEVLQATPLINPGGKYTMTIKVPAIPGIIHTHARFWATGVL